MNLSLLRQYTRKVLEFELTEKDAPTIPPCDPAKSVERCVRAFSRVPSPVLILFGAGSGTLAAELDATLPDEAVLVVCELSPVTARMTLAVHPKTFRTDGRTVILSDTSPWSMLYLLHLAGLEPHHACLMLNPEIGKGPTRTTLDALRRMVAAATPRSIEQPNADTSLSCGAILHPEDAGLEGFFAQFPDWIKELVVVWDAQTPSDTNYPCNCPVTHLAHPLDDFASQRNRMLNACTGDMVMYLDADEKLPAGGWDDIANLAGSDYEAIWFPRETLFPDETHCKVGYGLWPDLQLRLFTRNKARFVRPIHERIEGLDGPAALLLDLPILHESRLRKDDTRIREKLSRFDKASESSIRHMLNDEYPFLSRTTLSEHAKKRILRLERNPA